MKKRILSTFLLMVLLLAFSKLFYAFSPNISNNEIEKTAIMTYVSNNEQERSVKALIKSIRDLSGKYSKSKIYIVLSDPENFPCSELKGESVELIPLKIDQSILNYPLAIKAFAAAEVEKLVKNEIRTLIWFDPGVIVLNSLDSLALTGRYNAAFRSVSLVNNIGLQPNTVPNEYWLPIYKENKLDYKKLHVIETVVDSIKIQPYYNCEVYSINPKLGICREWARQLELLLKDGEYQKNACTSFQRKLFLHQAVLSGIIASKVRKSDLKPLSILSGYPFSQHDRLSVEKKITNLNQLSVVIFDYTWEGNPGWLKTIPVNEPLKTSLFNSYLDYLKLADKIYRLEGSCNSYLIVTEAGSVLIDPAGASIAPEYFNIVIEKNPLKAILLTHAHQDHSNDIAKWKAGKDIPVIAQREFKHYFEYQSAFSGFFARRNAIWAGKPYQMDTAIKQDSRNEATILFADDYSYELGGIHFKMIHTSGETPDHSVIWVPELSAVFIGDNYYKYFINNSTFRGTMIRPVKGYINALDTALSFSPEYFMPGHGSPIVSNKLIAAQAGNLRDALKFIYSETLKGINEGKDVYKIMQDLKLPSEYGIGEYYGKVEWTIRGIYQEYVGWFDENPAAMYSIPESSIYADILELTGTEALLMRAEKLFNEKEFVKVLYLTEIILNSDPKNEIAKQMRIKALESLKAGTRNYIERIWLNYGIRLANDTIKP